MAGRKRSKATDIVFEGVVIPKGTRSAKLATKGITNVDEMSEFLTAIFSDTLNGKITLPAPEADTRVSAKMLTSLDQKLKQGLPMKIQGTDPGAKRKRKPRIKKSKEQTHSG
jgi:hypothetical protein